MNDVTLLRLVWAANFCFSNFPLKSTTFLAKDNLWLYPEGLKLLWGSVPNVLVTSHMSSVEMLANVEKYVALFVSSPPRKANIFMSLGSSEKIDFNGSIVHSK